jgi:hypothetical protein
VFRTHPLRDTNQGDRIIPMICAIAPMRLATALIHKMMLLVVMVSSFGPAWNARDEEEPDGQQAGAEQAACAALAGDAAQAPFGAEASAL